MKDNSVFVFILFLGLIVSVILPNRLPVIGRKIFIPQKNIFLLKERKNTLPIFPLNPDKYYKGKDPHPQKQKKQKKNKQKTTTKKQNKKKTKNKKQNYYSTCVLVFSSASCSSIQNTYSYKF